MSYEREGKTHRRTVSAGDACSPPDLCNPVEKSNIKESASQNGKIAPQTYSPKLARHFIQGLSATWSGKPPKVPQPEQAELTFSIIGSGLREIIKLAKDDLMSLKFAADSSSLSSHQIRAAERYLKKLEFHLSKLEELQEKYEVQRKMRDGIRSMTNAYILSHGKERAAALHNVHTGYKECNELLFSYETKLQHMMGTFLFEMIGIQGFARMCCGDVFEIVIKHGDQKWKSRGYVLKNSKQSWENKKILFRAMFKEPLYIKAVEVRGLGKNILLGNKYCETKDLFCAHPQQMTINLNPSGSLKLSLIITWNPVHGLSDESSLHSRTSFGSQSVLNKDVEMRSSLKRDHAFKEKAFSMNKEAVQSLFVSCGELSAINTEVSSRRMSNENYILQNGDGVSGSSPVESDSCSRPVLMPICKSSADIGSQIWSSIQSVNSSECNSIEMASSSELSCSNSSRLHDALCSLSSSLERVLEQYHELEELCNNILEIENCLKFQQHRSLGSDVSISIKSALGCFDFLNSAVDEEELDAVSESMVDERNSSSNVPLYNLNNEDASPYPSPEPFTSGVEHVDVALTIHADYCLKLIEKLCSTSPLKCLENLSLYQLQKQASCFGSFLKLIRMKNCSDKLVSCVFSEDESQLKILWLKLAQVDSLCLAVDQMLLSLEKLVRSFLCEGSDNISFEVASRMLSQMIDRKCFGSDTFVTVYQFRLYFSGKESVHSVIQEVFNEVEILAGLRSKQADRVRSAFSKLKQVIPFTDALFEVACLLTENEMSLRRLSESYLKEIASDNSSKQKAVVCFLEGLESEEKRIRHGCCAALRAINAFSCCEQLVYISYADESPQVRHEAKIALFAFGETGRKLYEEYEKFTSCTRNSSMK